MNKFDNKIDSFRIDSETKDIIGLLATDDNRSRNDYIRNELIKKANDFRQKYRETRGKKIL